MDVQFLARIIIWLVIGSFLVMAILYLSGAYLLFSAATSMDWSGGVKPIIEQLWCGVPGCLGSP